MRLLVFLLAGAVSVPAAPTAAKVDFNRQIRPLLSDSCFACHGPDEKRRMAGLRLDDKDSALKAVTPGNRAASKLFQRISHADAARRMPPQAFDRKLTPAQVDLIGRWIDEGAEWKTHWSYSTPKRSALPEVAATGWARNEIDRFVLARLEKEGLKPAVEADRTTLLRRVTLDLTGLPPTPVEVQAFLANKSPEAYEKVVDRLLKSPHFGERMAMPWLDLARYADTHGYHIDSHRDMWPWRDWVIKSFNENMRFDQFALWQLAGDLLPNPTREQRLATGFNRNHMINFEGGAIPEEYLTEYIIDRVETTSVAFMGMTMGCARCHDHKYDPVSQRDFYRFFAFFNNVDEKGLDGREGNAKPMLPLPEPSQESRLAELRASIAAREGLLPEKEVDAAVTQWATSAAPSIGPAGALAHYEMDGTFSDVSGAYRHARVIAGSPNFSGGPAGQSLNFDGETQVDWFDGGALDQPLSVSLWLRLGNKLEQAVLRRSDGQRSLLVRTEEAISIGELKRGARLVVSANGKTLRTRRYVVQGDFTQVGIVTDGADRLQIYLNGVATETDALPDQAIAAAASPWTTGSKSYGMPFRSQLDDLRIYQRALTGEEMRELASDAVVRAILHTPAAKRSKDQKDRVREFYLTHVAPETQRKAFAELKELRKSEEVLDKTVITAMVMTELPKMRDTYVLGRGDYRNKTEKVTPAVPASLPPLPPGLPANRLGLAKWLIDPSHPLTARVTVNRFWQNLFGAGLVETSEDLGSQGAPPTHPELLDWLAVEFTESGWDVKAIQKKIVMSATYRQSAKATPESIEKDPQNRLLARMSRFRMPAEMVRDNALAVAGLLNREVGGRSVYPYQPAGLWEELAYGDVFSAQTYAPSTGKDLYRRSMYTFWKRTVPPAQMSTFDAPDREKCVARRARTNTPLQALILMNDPTYLEAARKLAERVVAEGGKDTARRINVAFQLAASRAPVAAETKLLAQLAQSQLATYKKDPALAAKLLAIGESKPNPAIVPAELAAWTTVASAILNLDEVITKE